MAYKLIQKFVNMLGDHSPTIILGPITPLILQVPWSKDPDTPLTLFGINRGRESLEVVDEYYYHLLCENRFREYVQKKISKKELEDEYYEYAARTKVIYDEAIQIDFSKTDEQTILQFFEKVVETFESIAFTVYIETFNYDIALKVVGQENKSTLDAIWEQATHPTFISFEGRRLAYLVKLVKETSDLSTLVRRVKWIYTDYHWTKSDADILSALKGIKDGLPGKEKELDSIYKNVVERKSVYETWDKSLTPEERFLAEYIQMIMLFRDIRKDPLAQIQAVIIEVVTELLNRADIDVTYGLALNVYECRKGVEYLKNIKDELIRRADGNISITHLDSTVEVELCEYEKAVEEFYTLTSKTSGHSINSVTGQIANKGKVTGTVRVILDPHDEKGFMDGDILVTSMTRPEFVSLMKRAGGVVTNEGGITSHAAIVSRELKKPCIIGTKNATRVLHDGDLVEVDADKGIVRIIEKKI